MNNQIRSLLTLLCILILLGVVAFGQTDRGTLTGRMADSSGALNPEDTIQRKGISL